MVRWDAGLLAVGPVGFYVPFSRQIGCRVVERLTSEDYFLNGTKAWNLSQRGLGHAKKGGREGTAEMLYAADGAPLRIAALLSDGLVCPCPAVTSG